MATTTKNHSIKDDVNKLSSRESKFTADTAALLIQLKNAIDIDTDADALEMSHFKLKQIYKSLENLTGELYLTVLLANGRVSYLKKDKNRTGAK